MVTTFRLVLEGVPYDIERRGDLIVVNGQEFPWSLDGGLFCVSGSSHTVEVRGNMATVDGIAYTIEAQGLAEAKPRQSRNPAPAPAYDDAGAIMAVMPGLIVKVNKQEGDHVEAGEVVMVLEAMKMQNELHAKRAGIIKQIAVKAGQKVEMRQLLAVVD